MSTPHPPVTLHGLNEVEAAFTTGLLLALAGPLLCGGPSLAPVVALLLLLAPGHRYRLVVGASGIHLTHYVAWLVPTTRLRFPLDARIELYQSWEADDPEGLCIEPRRAGRSSDCFGPHFGQARIAAVAERARGALARARLQATAPGPIRLNLGGAGADALLPESCTTWPSGRLRTATLARPLCVAGLVLPSGTRLDLNDDGYLDPNEPDDVTLATLSGPTALPCPELPPARAGARLWFDGDGRPCSVHGAAEGAIRIGRFEADGSAPIAWDEAGRVTRLTLAQPLVLGDRALPPGTSLSSWLGGGWYASLVAPLSLPELEIPAGRSALLDPSGTRLVGVMPATDTVVRGQPLRGGVLHLPLTPSLTVDLERCRAMGLWRTGVPADA